MAQPLAMISVKPETRDRVFSHKRAGVSYDTLICEMLKAYEEKMNESPAKSCQTCQPGEHTHTCECNKGVV